MACYIDVADAEKTLYHYITAKCLRKSAEISTESEMQKKDFRM